MAIYSQILIDLEFGILEFGFKGRLFPSPMAGSENGVEWEAGGKKKKKMNSLAIETQASRTQAITINEDSLSIAIRDGRNAVKTNHAEDVI